MSAIVGPSVMRRKLNEAGYLVVLRNESAAGIAPVAVHGRGSPYRLRPLRSRKSAVPPRPDRVADPVSSCRLERQDLVRRHSPRP